mmetsp:Transcript_31771/g.48762  ORF Transcript_31771/g.48762 Transcript_31771/m.48762 type:complete len:134 (+) Transcript_31771:175-576(+)
MLMLVLFTRPTIKSIGDHNPHKQEVLHFNTMIAAGLFFCGLGDLSIGTIFLVGVAGYLLGHLCLIAGMYHRIKLLSPLVQVKTKPYLAIVAVYLLIYLTVLYTHMDKLGLEVALGIYALTIGTMVLTSMTLSN